MQSTPEIIIIGAGPAGLTLSLLLARNNIKSLVLEKSLQATDDTRAVFYNAASQFEFERAGILDQVKQRGFHINAASFRDLSGKRLFAMPGAGQISLIQKELTAIIQEAVEEDKLTEILWGHEVVELGQDEESAWVDVQTANAKSRLSAKYIVGCDGGSSTVRRMLFGKDAMKGFTWEKPLVTIDIKYDLHAHLKDADDSNLFLDENDGWITFRTNKNDMNQWRVIYRDTPDLSQGEYKQRSEQRLKQLLPGRPDVTDYKLVRIKAYQVHQRAVEKMRQGRFILAGDAAHLCAPTGALGLNGAVADASSLSDCLVAILQGKASDDILDKYSEIRLQKFKTVVDPQSQGMMKMIFSNPNSIVPNHPAYKFSQLLAADPEKAKTMGPDPLILRADFTEYMTL